MRKTLLAVCTVALLVLCGTLMAQQDQGGQGGDRRGRFGGDRGSFDPARMQEMMLDRLKERMNPSEQEWTVIKPLLNDVVRLRFAAERSRSGGSMFGGRGGSRGPGGQPGGQPGGMDQERMQRMQQENPEGAALYQALENPSTPASDIKARLDAYRAAQKKKEDELKAAREKLRAVLSARQEAVLVLAGYMD